MQFVGRRRGKCFCGRLICRVYLCLADLIRCVDFIHGRRVVALSGLRSPCSNDRRTDGQTELASESGPGGVPICEAS